MCVSNGRFTATLTLDLHSSGNQLCQCEEGHCIKYYKLLVLGILYKALLQDHKIVSLLLLLSDTHQHPT